MKPIGKIVLLLLAFTTLRTPQTVQAQVEIAPGSFLSIDFPGGTIASLYAAIAKSNGAHFNLIGENGALAAPAESRRATWVRQASKIVFQVSSGQQDAVQGVAADYTKKTGTEVDEVSESGGGGSSSMPHVGGYTDLNLTDHGFLLRDGSFTTIGVPDALSTDAFDINDRSDIAGLYADTNFGEHGFLLHQGVFSTIDFPEAVGTAIVGLNATGDLVGNYVDHAFRTHGFVRIGGNFKTLDIPGAPQPSRLA